MSSAERWGALLGIDKKEAVIYNFSRMIKIERATARILLLELSIPVIDDSFNNEYIQVLKNITEISHTDAIQYFVQRSKYWWHVREWSRFVSGYHQPIPSAELNLYANFAGQFPHISREDKSRVAILMDQKKAEQDMHTTMKIGRFLSKQTNAPESAIPDISNLFANRNKIHILEEATTPGEIQWVFENGPNSCMGKKMTDGIFATRVHPAQAYASPDIKTLFVRDLENQNRVIARCAMSVHKNKFTKIYGNANVMAPLLAAAGIGSQVQGCFNNHRLLKITEHHNDELKHIGPYIDCGDYPIYTDPTDDKYLIINPSGSAKDFGAHIGRTHRSHTGKGFINTPAPILCHFCSDPYIEGNIRFFEHDNIHACSECQHTHMVRRFNRFMESVYTVITNPSFDVKINTWDPFVKKTILEKRSFLNEEAFTGANLYKYKDTDTYIRGTDRVYIKHIDMHVHKKEAIIPLYSNTVTLVDDCTIIADNYVSNNHIHNGKFKFTTLCGFDTKYILNNLSTFYFKTMPISMEDARVVITKVSRVSAPDLMSLSDFWNHRLDAAREHSELANILLQEVMNTDICIGVLPDDPKQELYPNISIKHCSTFFNSWACSKQQIRIPRMNIPADIPNKKHRRKKKLSTRKPSDVFELNGDTWAIQPIEHERANYE